MNSLTPRQRQAHELRQSGLKYREIARLMNRKPEQIRMWCAIARRKLGLSHEHL